MVGGLAATLDKLDGAAHVFTGLGALVLFAVGLTNWPINQRKHRKLEQTLPIS